MTLICGRWVSRGGALPMRPISVVLAMVAALLLVFLAIAARAGEPPPGRHLARIPHDMPAGGTAVAWCGP
jgi:hypothetical protein